MFVFYLTFFLTFILLAVVSLASAANGAGPSALSPVQSALKPVAGALNGVLGTIGIIAVLWGSWLTVTVILGLLTGFDFGGVLKLIEALLLVVLGTLAAYVAVAAFFGAPASGAGKFIDGIKRSFGSIEAILGLLGLVLALWMLIEFILNRAGVYL